MRLAGKTALVTGAASGIGEAVVRRFREEGAEVVAAGLQPELLAELVRQTGARAVDCDVTRESDVRRAVDEARASGRLDIVVNAAGIIQTDDVAEIDDRVWERTLAVNLTGAMRVCRAAIPHMQRQGGGAIVNIASVAAFNASAGMGSYAPSKAGLVALTRSIANRYGAEAIRANCLCPGWVRTPMSELEMREAGDAKGIGMEQAFDELKARIALKRIGLPTEMAACVLFLASDDASFVTGAVLVADGCAKTAAAARAN